MDRNTQGLREVHERLVSFIAAHTCLSKATLGLADSIVEFYAPEVRRPEICRVHCMLCIDTNGYLLLMVAVGIVLGVLLCGVEVVEAESE